MWYIRPVGCGTATEEMRKLSADCQRGVPKSPAERRKQSAEQFVRCVTFGTEKGGEVRQGYIHEYFVISINKTKVKINQ